MRLTRDADRDISRILADTYRLFGPHQFERYTGIIEHGMKMIADEPHRASSKSRPDLREGVRSFHLQLAAGRRGGAAHVIYYHLGLDKAGRAQLVVLRVLADAMEPKRRVLQALRDEERREND